ncbi:MAG TPA: PilZ domain-containing protein [Candidatus Aminicenantes bacterium]|nr:PilZ domain-containing protein [Candidatus Aminicenantes bacterium]HDT13909.1 PilZ domain-containing protein [Candidatus Aminicenantes bacterium]
MFERRKRNRFVERNEILVRTAVDKYQGPGVAAHTYDLSTGGARIVTSKNYPVGSVIRIRLLLAATDQIINLDGLVRWTRPKDNGDTYEIGVEFESLTSQAVLLLIRHLYGRNEGVPSTIG